MPAAPDARLQLREALAGLASADLQQQSAFAAEAVLSAHVQDGPLLEFFLREALRLGDCTAGSVRRMRYRSAKQGGACCRAGTPPLRAACASGSTASSSTCDRRPYHVPPAAVSSLAAAHTSHPHKLRCRLASRALRTHSAARWSAGGLAAVRDALLARVGLEDNGAAGTPPAAGYGLAHSFFCSWCIIPSTTQPASPMQLAVFLHPPLPPYSRRACSTGRSAGRDVHRRLLRRAVRSAGCSVRQQGAAAAHMAERAAAGAAAAGCVQVRRGRKGAGRAREGASARSLVDQVAASDAAFNVGLASATS